MVLVNGDNYDQKSVHQSPNITLHFIALITSKSVTCEVASGYINTVGYTQRMAYFNINIFYRQGLGLHWKKRMEDVNCEDCASETNINDIL